MISIEGYKIEIPPMRSLDQSEFLAIYNIRNENKKKTMGELKAKIIDKISRFRFTSSEDIQHYYEDYLKQKSTISIDFSKLIQNETIRDELKYFINSPNKFLKNSPFPFFKEA